MSLPSGRTIMIAASSVVAAAVVVGIAIIGSPGAGRIQQLDASRVEDLQAIMSATDLYWARNDRLPASLAELDQDPRVVVNAIDPGSATPYEYRVRGEERYELCAVFDRESMDPVARSGAEFWRHGAGRVCFDLQVDPTVRVRP